MRTPDFWILRSFVSPDISSLPLGLSWRRGFGHLIIALAIASCLTGCGTTRITGTSRTATEQLLMSGAIDRAIDDIDCTPLAGKSIFVGTDYYRPTGDQQYLVDTVRQKLLASGCTLKTKETDAELVMNLRVGTIGTDSNRLIFGVPSVNVPPALAALSSSPMSIPTIPEVPLVTKQAQRGVAKIGLFAYDRETGSAYWQSGASPMASTAKEVWVLGAGPWQWGTIYDQPKFAGGNMSLTRLYRKLRGRQEEVDPTVTVASTATFFEPDLDVPSGDIEPGKIQLAGHADPIKPDEADKPESNGAPKPIPKAAAAAAKPVPKETPAPAKTATKETPTPAKTTTKETPASTKPVATTKPTAENSAAKAPPAQAPAKPIPPTEGAAKTAPPPQK